MVIPVSLAGLVTLWVSSIVLIGWNLFGASDGIGNTGLLCSAGAASWTVIYGLARHYELMARMHQRERESVSRIS